MSFLLALFSSPKPTYTYQETLCGNEIVIKKYENRVWKKVFYLEKSGRIVIKECIDGKISDFVTIIDHLSLYFNVDRPSKYILKMQEKWLYVFYHCPLSRRLIDNPETKAIYETINACFRERAWG